MTEGDIQLPSNVRFANNMLKGSIDVLVCLWIGIQQLWEAEMVVL